MASFVFVKKGKAPLSRALREIKQLLCVQSLILYYIKQIDSMLPCICPVIDHRGRQNVVRTTVTHSAIASRATFLFLPHFDVICDLLLDRCTATWNLFVNFTINAEIHARSLANFYRQYADRHMNLKFMGRVSVRERAIRKICYRKKQIDVSL